jgi:hypothetical protein
MSGSLSAKALRVNTVMKNKTRGRNFINQFDKAREVE